MYKSDYFSCLSPINQAHLLERKANSYLKKEKYEDAIALHIDAANLLQDVLEHAQTIGVHKNVIVSLQSQIRFHKKQDKLIMLRKEQREELREKLQQKRSLKTSQEPFQDLINYSTTSLDSYDSTDLVSATSSYNSTNNNSNSNILLQEHLNKRDEVIKTLGLLVRQQQAQILVLSSKLKEKNEENQRLHTKIENLERSNTSS